MKLGVFGGSFDPLHCGHLIVADDAASELGLDRVLFVPSGIHPFKGSEVETPPELRFRMVSESVADYELFAVDGREIRRVGPSYTIDTLEELASEFPGAELFLLVGSDILVEIQKWHRSDDLARLATIAVMTRARWDAEPGGSTPIDHIAVEVPYIAVSSSDIRHRVREGRPFRYLVPDSVHRTIVEHSLYKAYDD